jgi:HEAT repeat protein
MEKWSNIEGSRRNLVALRLIIIVALAFIVLELYIHKDKIREKAERVNSDMGMEEILEKAEETGMDEFLSIDSIDMYMLESELENLDSRHDDVRERAAEALGRIGDPRAVDPLIESLKDEDLFVRYFSAKALGETGDPKAIRPLKRARRKKENKQHPFTLKGMDEAIEKLEARTGT